MEQQAVAWRVSKRGNEWPPDLQLMVAGKSQPLMQISGCNRVTRCASGGVIFPNGSGPEILPEQALMNDNDCLMVRMHLRSALPIQIYTTPLRI
jgi:hypothetical protein